MRRKRGLLLFRVFALAVLLLLSTAALSVAEEVTITGTVTQEGNIMADDGQLYVVEDDEMQDELMELVGKKLEVAGTVGERDGKKILTIQGYEEIQ